MNTRQKARQQLFNAVDSSEIGGPGQNDSEKIDLFDESESEIYKDSSESFASDATLSENDAASLETSDTDQSGGCDVVSQNFGETVVEVGGESQVNFNTLTATTTITKAMTTDERCKYFREMDSILPAFDPVKDDISIDEWIKKIDVFESLYGWDETAKKHYALSKLVGVAKSWRDSLPAKARTWHEWKELLIEAFPCDDSELKKRKEAENYRRKTGQDITEYFYEKLAKCNKAGMSQRESIERIVDGINNSRIRDYLGPLSRYGNPSKLLPDLKSATHLFQDEKQKPKFDSNGGNKKEIKSEKKKFTCFNCKEEGHAANVCTKPRNNNCFLCDKSGHLAKDCPTKCGKNSSQKTKSSKEVLHIQSGQRKLKYFKNACINGQTIKCYVDPGSEAVALREDIARELQLKYTESCDYLKGCGNGEVRTLGELEAEVSIDEVALLVKIHVVPDNSQNIPLIVGQPYIDGVICECIPYEITIMHASDDMKEITPEQEVKTPIWAREAKIIPNNYVGFVSVRTLFPNENLCLEGGIREDGRLMPRCFINTDKEGMSEVPILNMTGKDVNIKEGTILTRAETIDNRLDIIRQEVNNIPITMEELNTDNELPREETQKVLKIINDYNDLIARNMRQIGCTNMAEMKITLDDTTPYNRRPHRVSYPERKKLQCMIRDLEEADMIEDSESPFSSPVLLVEKKTGDVRMCIDYRGINKATVKQQFPLPLIDDQLDRMQGMKYFTTLDLSSGYYQVPVAKDSRHITAFSTPDGHYQFKRMPFGLCNAPAVFQRLINKVLGKLLYTVAMAYLDDIIIPSRTIDDGLEKLKLVLDSLRAANLTLRLDKCYFLSQNIEYLGFEISAEGISPGRRKLRAIEEFPIPTDVSSVRSFIGLTGYFRRFVRGYSVIARPLTDLMGKNVNFVWGREQEDAFAIMKNKLSNYPVLKVFNPEARTEVHTDASSKGLGGILLQEGKDGKLRAVSYFSRKTTKDEAKYHSYELEALAIVSTLERFRTYLIGIPFVIKTDCNSLKLLASKADLGPRIERWFVKLSKYNYIIEYQKG